MRVSLTALRAFDTVARLGHIGRAADELGVGPTTISRHVAALERRIGAPLLRRQGRGIALTPFGEEYHEAIRGAFGSIETATDRLAARARGDAPPLTIVSDTAMLIRFIAPRLPALRRALPGLGLRLLADGTPLPEDPAAPILAIAYRRGQAVQGATILSEPRVVAVAAGHAAPLAAGAPLDGQCLLHLRSPGTWEEWLGLTGQGPPPCGPGIVLPDKASLLAAAEAGSGLALACVTLAGEAIREGRLRQVLGPGAVMGAWVAECSRGAPGEQLIAWLRAEISAAEAAAPG
jgi:LysR family transcriptional regulator, glycine cleavage system transcriptional activator